MSTLIKVEKIRVMMRMRIIVVVAVGEMVVGRAIIMRKLSISRLDNPGRAVNRYKRIKDDLLIKIKLYFHIYYLFASLILILYVVRAIRVLHHLKVIQTHAKLV